jgi:hypothetical protein
MAIDATVIGKKGSTTAIVTDIEASISNASKSLQFCTQGRDGEPNTMEMVDAFVVVASHIAHSFGHLQSSGCGKPSQVGRPEPRTDYG